MSGDSTTCENTAARLLGASGGASSSLRSCHDITFSPLVSGTKTTETQVRPRAQNWHNVFERVSNALRLDLVEMHILVMNPRRRGWLLAVFLASPLLFILLAVSADQKISGLDVTWPHTCQSRKKTHSDFYLGRDKAEQTLAWFKADWTTVDYIGNFNLMHQWRHLTGDPRTPNPVEPNRIVQPRWNQPSQGHRVTTLFNSVHLRWCLISARQKSKVTSINGRSPVSLMCMSMDGGRRPENPCKNKLRFHYP